MAAPRTTTTTTPPPPLPPPTTTARKPPAKTKREREIEPVVEEEEEEEEEAEDAPLIPPRPAHRSRADVDIEAQNPDGGEASDGELLGSCYDELKRCLGGVTGGTVFTAAVVVLAICVLGLCVYFGGERFVPALLV
ncbi:hypothetical protein FGG08_006819 [Glutinoglossum americanum]|uniref:Uncharacterized protein n=1 Tax=Glutinoglossum americanum TaxID=1670608 RepID=A0A9P8I4H7_9PEZI|nr:hypothetical protein FGG08_006819 [Glutinoglossum americanum]